MRELNQDLLTNPDYEENTKEERATNFMDNNYWKPIILEIDNDIDELLKEDLREDINIICQKPVSLEEIKITIPSDKQEEILIQPKYPRLLNKRKSSSNNISEEQYFDNSYWKVDIPSIESIDISGLLIDN